MKIKDLHYELGNEIRIVFVVESESLEEVFNVCEQEITDKDYEIIVRPKRKDKSTEQVKYFWELINQLGTKLKLPNQEIYKQLVQDNGVFQIVPIKESEIEHWIRIWEEQGRDKNGNYSKGWFCEDLGECQRTKGYHNIKCYYGIRVYSTEELSRVITQLENECKEQGIFINE